MYFTILALATFLCFIGLFMLRGDFFFYFYFLLYIFCFNCLLIYNYEFFIDICLYCVLFEIKNLFYLLVFSTHVVMHFFSVLGNIQVDSIELLSTLATDG